METVRNAYTTKELATLLKITRQAIEQRALRESWSSRPRPGRGGGHVWLIASMPEPTRLALAVALEKQALANLPAAPVASAPAIPGLHTAALPGTLDRPLDPKRRTKALAKADLVRLYLDWLVRHGKSQGVRNDFIRAFNGGAWPELRVQINEVSWQSLERWKVQQREYQDLAILADKRGLAHRGRSMLTDRHREIFLGQALSLNNPAISYTYNRAKDVFLAEGLFVPSEATARRFLANYMQDCNAEWVFFREGKKAWNDKCAFYLERDWSLAQVGDILIADGHTLNFESINPETGKACRLTLLLWYDGASNFPLGWELMPSENVACISSALRRAIIRLGKIPRVAYLDNGKAFRAKFFKGCSDFRQAGIVPLYENLGTKVIHAWDYHGQSKTVERFFGTLHELENYVPSYTGRSIDTQPARMHRGENVHRKLYAAAGGRPLTLMETHAAIAWFFDKYVQRPQRGHLKGRTPIEVFAQGVGPGVDIARLNELMLMQEIREIGRGGVIKILGNRYYAPELYGKKRPALVRHDALNPESILVYGTDGVFLAEARQLAQVHPAAWHLGDEDQQRLLSEQIGLRKEQEKLAGASAAAMIEALVLPEHQRRMHSLGMDADALPAELGAAPARKALPLPLISESEAARMQAELAERQAVRAARPAYEAPNFFASEAERYGYLFTLSVEQEIALLPADADFCNAYEQSEEYQKITGRRFTRLREIYAKHREQVA